MKRKINRATYVNMLPTAIQEAVLEDLIKKGIKDKDLSNAMHSRLCDLEDTIDISIHLSNSRTED